MIDQALLAVLEATRIPAIYRLAEHPYAYPYLLPVYQPQAAAGETKMVTDVQAWTGWSNRSLAEIIGTTHPTIRALQDGRLVVGVHRNRQYPERLRNVWDLVARVFLLTGRDAIRTSALLSDPSHGESAVSHLLRGDATAAYRTVIDLTRAPERPALIGSWRPLDPRGRTIDPFDVE